MKLIIFDIDGTLLRTGGAGKIAFNRVFAELFGQPNAWQDIIPDGKTDPKIIEELACKNLGRSLRENEYQAVVSAYVKYFEKEIARSPNFRLLPGIQNLLEALSADKNMIVGLATGNFKITAHMKLDQGKIRHHFQFGGFGCDSSDRPALTASAVDRGRQTVGKRVDSKDIFLVGDTGHDIAAGKAIGVRTIAVATGGTSRSSLERHQPDFLFDNFGNIEHVLSIFQHG